jgi:hypothetical protein
MEGIVVDRLDHRRSQPLILGGVVERSIPGDDLIAERDRPAAIVVVIRRSCGATRTRISMCGNGRLGRRTFRIALHPARIALAQPLRRIV